MRKPLAIIIGLAMLGTVTLGQTIVSAGVAARPDIASALLGTWQARQAGGIVEEIEFGPLAGNGAGRFSSRKSDDGWPLDQFSGHWRLHRNPLLPKDSRWQLHLVWQDRIWGPQKREFAIRHLSTDRLALGNIYLDSRTRDFRRVGR